MGAGASVDIAGVHGAGIIVGAGNSCVHASL